jgi:hypothetical protein
MHNTKVIDYGYAYNTTYDQFISMMDLYGEQPLNFCSYKLLVYPSSGFKDQVRVKMSQVSSNYFTSACFDLTDFATFFHPSYFQFISSRGNMYRGIVIVALFIVLLVFFASDFLIERKHQDIVNAAARSDAIVRSLFPGSVADRLYDKHKERQIQSKKPWRAKGKGTYVATQKSRLSSLLRTPLENQEFDDEFLENEPLADLYPSASVIFAGMCIVT